MVVKLPSQTPLFKTVFQHSLSMKPLDIFKETGECFPVMFTATESGVLIQRSSTHKEGFVPEFHLNNSSSSEKHISTFPL